MRKIIIMTVCLVFTLCALPAYSIELPIDALKAKECKVPQSFAKIIKVGEEEEEKIIFGDSSTFYCPVCLNDTLNSYGVSLTVEALKAKECKVPQSFAKIIKVGEGEEQKEEIVFGTSTVMYPGSSLNKIFNGYGLSMSREALKMEGNKVPKSYAQIVFEDSDEEAIVFGNTGAYAPNSLNDILSSYN